MAAKASSKVAQGSGSQSGKHVAAGDVGVRARLALVGDRPACVMGIVSVLRRDGAGWPARARGRAACRRRAARRPRSATSMRMPASSARSCSSRSRFSSGEGGSGDEALQRRAAIGVEPDVVIERPVARGRGGAGEVERAQPAGPRSACRRPSRRSGSSRSSSRVISAARVAMSTAGSASGSERRPATARGSMVGRSPCTLTTTSWRPSGSNGSTRLEDAVGAGGMVGARHHGVAADRLDGLDDPRLVGRDHDGAEAGLHGAAPDMHDHRLALDVGERLAGQPRRGHAGGNEDDGIGHAAGAAVGQSAESGKKYQRGNALIRVAKSARKAGNHAAAERRARRAACRGSGGGRLADARRGAQCRTPRDAEPEPRGRSDRMFGMDSFEFNKIAGAVLGTLLFVMGMGILAEIDLRRARSRWSPATRCRPPRPRPPLAAAAGRRGEPLPGAARQGRRQEGRRPA